MQLCNFFSVCKNAISCASALSCGGAFLPEVLDDIENADVGAHHAPEEPEDKDATILHHDEGPLGRSGGVIPPGGSVDQGRRHDG